MSKSLGNIVEPMEIIRKYSADALRFWAAGSKLGDDLPFMEKDLLTGQKFANKLWNATKFCGLHLEDYKEPKKIKLEVFDAWLLHKLQKTIQYSTESFEQYEYARTKAEVEQFFWHTFCDNYLEIVKERLYNPDVRGKDARKSAQLGLYQGIISILKLMAPIMPHITEEIYQEQFAGHEKAKSIHISSWPTVRKEWIDEKAEEAGDMGVDIINTVRKFKSAQQMSLKQELKEVVLVHTDPQFEKKITPLLGDLKAVLNVKTISFKGKTPLESEQFKISIGVSL